MKKVIKKQSLQSFTKVELSEQKTKNLKGGDDFVIDDVIDGF